MKYISHTDNVFTFVNPLSTSTAPNNHWNYTFEPDRVPDPDMLNKWLEDPTIPIEFYIPHLTEAEIAMFTFGVTPDDFTKYLLPDETGQSDSIAA